MIYRVLTLERFRTYHTQRKAKAKIYFNGVGPFRPLRLTVTKRNGQAMESNAATYNLSPTAPPFFFLQHYPHTPRPSLEEKQAFSLPQIANPTWRACPSDRQHPGPGGSQQAGHERRPRPATDTPLHDHISHLPLSS
jgi:hypothetical protein